MKPNTVAHFDLGQIVSMVGKLDVQSDRWEKYGFETAHTPCVVGVNR